jgi:hypothetical protein
VRDAERDGLHVHSFHLPHFLLKNSLSSSVCMIRLNFRQKPNVPFLSEQSSQGNRFVSISIHPDVFFSLNRHLLPTGTLFILRFLNYAHLSKRKMEVCYRTLLARTPYMMLFEIQPCENQCRKTFSKLNFGAHVQFMYHEKPFQRLVDNFLVVCGCV